MPGLFDGMEIVQFVYDEADVDPEELAMMEEAYGDDRYRVICPCGADLEQNPLPGCAVPFVHGDDVYR